MTTDRSQKDLDLWQHWTSGGRKPDDLEPLLDQFEPVLQSHLRQYSGKVNIPEPTIRADLENRFAKAVKTYDPGKGTQLATHVNWHLRGTHGFIVQNQNLGRIPENQVSKIRQYVTTSHQLQERLGGLPDDVAVASKMNWSPTQVKKLRRGMRRDLTTAAFDVPIGGVTPSRWNEIKELLPGELDDKEKYVFRHTVGVGGAKLIPAQDMAKHLGVSGAAISRARAAVARKLEKYIPSGIPMGRLVPSMGDGDEEGD